MDCKAVDPRADEAIAAAMEKMVELKNKMCECKDAACAQSVSDELSRWGSEHWKAQIRPPEMSAEESRRAVQVGEEMSKCMLRAMAAGRAK